MKGREGKPAHEPDTNHPFWQAVRGELPSPPCAQTLGWKVLEAELGSGRIRVEFDAAERFLNPRGHIQGGFLAAMLDDTMGPALATTFAAGEFGPTLELKVNFLRPALPGVLIGEGKVVHRGSSVAFLEGRLLDAQGGVVATATATAKLIRDAF